MKIRIKPNSLDYDNLKYYLVNEFPKIRFWELSGKRLIAEKNKLSACYIIPRKKAIYTIGGFPNMNTNFIAALLIVIGGFIIPLGLYFVLFFRSHTRLQRQLGETIAKKYARYHLINKTED